MLDEYVKFLIGVLKTNPALRNNSAVLTKILIDRKCDENNVDFVINVALEQVGH